MGNRKKQIKQKYIKYITDYNISHFSCNNCPAKLFYNNQEEPIREGLGSVTAKTMIVFPTYISVDEDKFCKLIDILDNAYKEKYSLSILDSIYITPCIKCYFKYAKYDIRNVVLEKCAVKTISELSRHPYIKRIILLGDAKQLDMIIPNTYNIHYVNAVYTIFDNDTDKENFINVILQLL